MRETGVYRGIKAHTNREVKEMKREEKPVIPWEAVDPKPPVIRSGHLENRKK